MDRPSAYGVLLDARQRLLCVHAAGGLHLPGGGLRLGEAAERGAVREVLEETGYRTEIVRLLGRADQYLVSAVAGGAYRKCGTFFLLRLVERPAPDASTDHTPVWLDAVRAARSLTHAFQRWAATQAIEVGGS
jgi:8-oxo-dGTP pyrophosphatase MutT (NUDIX family)